MAPYKPASRGTSKAKEDDYRSVSVEHSAVKKRTISRAEMMALIAERGQPENGRPPAPTVAAPREATTEPEPVLGAEPVQEAVIEATAEDVAEVEPVEAEPPALTAHEPVGENVTELFDEAEEETLPPLADEDEAPTEADVPDALPEPEMTVDEVAMEEPEPLPLSEVSAPEEAIVEIELPSERPPQKAKAARQSKPKTPLPPLIDMVNSRKDVFAKVVREDLHRLKLSQAKASDLLGFPNRGVFNNKLNGARGWMPRDLEALKKLTGKTEDDFIAAMQRQAKPDL